MIHIWFDPGDTTGWALFEDGLPIEMGELHYPSELFGTLVGLISRAELCGFENYRIQPKNSSARGYTPFWSEALPIRVIGAIEFASFQSDPNRRMVSQNSDIKPSGYGYAGMKYVKGKKGMHKEDAIAHGTFWWFMKGRHLA